jgi:hypothetical protein
MRHQVNQESGLQLKLTPFITKGLATLQATDVEAVMKIMASKKPGLMNFVE